MKSGVPLIERATLPTISLLVKVLILWALELSELMTMFHPEVEEVAEAEEADKPTLLVVKEDKTQNKHLRKLKKISQLYEREDLYDLTQKSWLIQVPLKME